VRMRSRIVRVVTQPSRKKQKIEKDKNQGQLRAITHVRTCTGSMEPSLRHATSGTHLRSEIIGRNM